MTKKSGNDNAFTTDSDYGIKSENTYAGALSYLRRRYSKDLQDVDLAVAGVPLDTATTNRPGTRFGPRAIRAASTLLTFQRPYCWDFDPFERISAVDFGDLHWDFGRPEKVPDEITRQVGEILESETALLCFGGDHFITYPILKAFAAKYGTLSMIHFDAHSDTWEDEDPERIDHGTMFYHAANQGIVDPSRSVQVGLRTINDDLRGFNVLDAPWVHANGAEAAAAEIKRIVGDHPVYMTFDIDCLDPAFAPGTGTPVCGGLSSHQALTILRGLCGIDLKGMDVVEVAPAYDVGEITALAGASIAYEMICLYAFNKPERA